MATIDRTPNGGTAGHPGNVARPYVMTSKVHDTADGGTGGDVIQLIDVPADTMIVSGVLEVLEARGNSQITMDIGITGGGKDSSMLYLKGVQTEKINNQEIVSKIVNLVEKKAIELENNK